MELAAAIALAVFYAGVTLAWGGVPPRSGAPWWVFAPFLVTCGAGLVYMAAVALLSAPWARGKGYGNAPRCVHLSWRSALRIPSLVPMGVLLGYVYWALQLHFHIEWVLYAATAVMAAVVAYLARQRLREFRLLRDGETAIGIVDERIILDGTNKIVFHFTTPHGETIMGRGWDLGYELEEGSRLPVYYDRRDPRNYVAACSSWLETD